MIPAPPNATMRGFWSAFALNLVWMNVSEVARYFLVVKPMVHADFAFVPGIVPDSPSIGILWALWDVILIFVTTVITRLVLARYGPRPIVALAAGTLVWAAVFVLLWLGLYNMGLARPHTVITALPLAWAELVVAAFLVRWAMPRYAPQPQIAA